jgi:hypothetical protein
LLGPLLRSLLRLFLLVLLALLACPPLLLDLFAARRFLVLLVYAALQN